MSRRFGIEARANTKGAVDTPNVGATIEFRAELNLAAEVEAEEAKRSLMRILG